MTKTTETDWVWVSEKQDTNRATDSTASREDRSSSSRRAVLRSGAAIGATAALGGLVGVAAGAETSERNVMFTGNAKDGTVSLSDAETFEPIKSIDTYPDQNKEDKLEDSLDHSTPKLLNTFLRENYLEHANVSPDGRTLYASRGHVGDILAIDIETGEKLWETDPVTLRTDHQVISDNGDYLYTSDLTSNQIIKIDADTGTIVGKVSIRNFPHGNHLHQIPSLGNEKMLINGSLGNMVYPDSNWDPLPHQLSFVDPESMQTVRTVDFENGVRPFAITEDGQKIYVQISYFHGFHEYDTKKDRITRTRYLPKTNHVPERERDFPVQSAHHGIGLSGDGKYIYVAGTTSWYAAIIRRADFELVETIPVGKYPYWVQTTPDGDHAFVPVRGENEISVINYANAEEVARIPASGGPHVIESETVPEEVL